MFFYYSSSMLLITLLYVEPFVSWYSFCFIGNFRLQYFVNYFLDYSFHLMLCLWESASQPFSFLSKKKNANLFQFHTQKLHSYILNIGRDKPRTAYCSKTCRIFIEIGGEFKTRCRIFL